MVGVPTEGGGGDRGAFIGVGSRLSSPGPSRISMPNSSWIGRGGGRSTIASSSYTSR